MIQNIPAYGIAGKMNGAAKSQLMDKSNNPDDATEVMVASSPTSALWLNPQDAGLRLVPWGLPENINAATQFFRQIHRMGQRHQQ